MDIFMSVLVVILAIGLILALVLALLWAEKSVNDYNQRIDDELDKKHNQQDPPQTGD